MTDSAATTPANPAAVLARLRTLSLVVGATLLALGIVLWFALGGQVTGDADDPLPWILVGVSLLWAVGGNRFAHTQILRATDLESFVDLYRTSFFVALAAAETPALMGFVAAFVIEAMWPFLVGLVPAVVGMWAIAPTPDRLRSFDRAFRSRGKDVKPSDLLQRPRPGAE